MDTFDVRERFARDPLGCLRNPKAKRILREQDFGWRPWARLPLADQRFRSLIATPDRWKEKYWLGLSGYVEEVVDDSQVAKRFADLLIGYCLVVENEAAPFELKQGSRKQGELRPQEGDLGPVRTPGRELRSLRGFIGSAASSHPQHAPSLRTRLIGIMVADLVKSGLSRERACNELIPLIWAAIEVKLNPSSVLRMERRSRKRTSATS